MAFEKDSVVHGIALMYCAFGHLTDGTLDRRELHVASNHILTWMEDMHMKALEDVKVDSACVRALLFEEVAPYYDSLSYDGKLAEYVRVAELLSAQEWWSDDVSMSLLDELKDVALADGHYDDNEKKWLETTAEVLGVKYAA